MHHHIYCPSFDEVAAIAEASSCKHPRLASRWARVPHLLALRRFWWSPGDHTWCFASSTAPTTAYRVSFGACTCRVFFAGRCTADGRAYCQHTLALLAYREILAGHLRGLAVGSCDSAAAVRLARALPQRSVLLWTLGEAPAWLAFTSPAQDFPALVCTLRSSPSGLVPRSESEAYRAGVWLDHRRRLRPRPILAAPLVTPWPAAAPALVDLSACLPNPPLRLLNGKEKTS